MSDDHSLEFTDESTFKIHNRSYQLIRHAYEELLTRSARLSLFATGRQTRMDGPIDQRQLNLALDDLALFGLHCRRLIDLVGVRQRFRPVEVPLIAHDENPQKSVGFMYLINVFVHLDDVEIFRNKFQIRTVLEGDKGIEYLSDYFGEFDDQFEPILAVKSDHSKAIVFRLVNLIEIFQAHVLSKIIDVCGEQGLYLEDDNI